MQPLPTATGWVIVGAGFAGAATAWALGRAGLGPGIIVEQEPTWGAHSSGRNAGMIRLIESDPIVSVLARRSLARIRDLERAASPLIQPVGGLTLTSTLGMAGLGAQHDALRAQGIDVELLSRAHARTRFPFLEAVNFETALWCRDEGVIDIHALLGLYLTSARATGFSLCTGCRAEGLIVENGRVMGVHTDRGDVRAGSVVDAGGAWAGLLGRSVAPLPLQPLRRHLFVSTPTTRVPSGAPLVWIDDASLYFRPESNGLLLSPCDETPATPGTPPTDPAMAGLLADKIAQWAPGLADLGIRRSWACLRTFAPDRRPLIGADWRLPGLLHVSGLGGFGMMCSAAIGELAADLLLGRAPDWIDPSALTPDRLRDGGVAIPVA